MISLGQNWWARAGMPAAVVAAWFIGGSAAIADQCASCGQDHAQMKIKSCAIDRHQHKNEPGAGTLGYGPPGLFPGFQGFGLGYHLGYGYGGDALGPGADGGYPYYGGPGYPHCWPTLRRCGGINPFPYYGGPGYPTPDAPNYYGGVGPLAANRPVIEIGREPGEADYNSGYGCFTGAVPYPESALAPFTARAAAAGSSSGVSRYLPAAPSASVPTNDTPAPIPSAPQRSLGIVTEPTIDAAGKAGVKITSVDAGGPADKAGLHVGDVIYSINDHLTTTPGNVTWILENVARDGVFTINVRKASDGNTSTVTARVP